MSILAPLTDMGVSVFLGENGKLKLQCGREIPEAVEYARQHKDAIIAELKSSANPAPLPDACPLVNGGPCPPGCRFTNEVLAELIESGELPNRTTGCPLRSACGLFAEWPLKRRQAESHRCLGESCAHGSFQEHGGILYLWCGQTQQPVIDLPSCPLGSWHRNEQGWPVHGAAPQAQAPLKVRSESKGYLDPRKAEAPEDCGKCPAYDVGTGRCYGTAYYERKAGPWYSGQEALDRCPRKKWAREVCE